MAARQGPVCIGAFRKLLVNVPHYFHQSRLSGWDMLAERQCMVGAGEFYDCPGRSS